MKLLFDQNLSFKLCTLLSDLFPDSKPVRELGLDQSDDRMVWQHAKDNDFMLVSQDSDFADMAAHYGHPPKVIWLRCGKNISRTAYCYIRLDTRKSRAQMRLHEYSSIPLSAWVCPIWSHWRFSPPQPHHCTQEAFMS